MATYRFNSTEITNDAAITITLPDEGRSVVSETNPWLPLSPYGEPDPTKRLQVDGVTFSNGVPVVRASSWRGAVRSQAALLAIGDRVLDYGSINANFVGGVKPKKDEGDPLTLAERVELRARNPVIGLFGACQPDFIGGSLLSGDLRLAVDPEGENRLEWLSVVRRDTLDRLPGIGSQVSDLSARAEEFAFIAAIREIEKKWEDENSALRNSARSELDPDLRRTLKSKIAENNREMKSEVEAYNKANNSSGKFNATDIRQLHAGDKLAIPAGMKFEQRLVVSGGTEVEMGLLILGLLAFRKTPRIGGRGASGCGGMLRFAYDIEVWNDAKQDFEHDGTLDDLGPVSRACVQAFRDGEAGFDYSVVRKGKVGRRALVA